MLLCSHVLKETPDTLTLIRVFSHIWAPEFPHHHGAIWVYAKINGIDIPCRIEVDVVSLHDGALVAGGMAQETITQAGEMPMELALVVENMEFLHSGPYAFRYTPTAYSSVPPQC